jgi:hypothetical protein
MLRINYSPILLGDRDHTTVTRVNGTIKDHALFLIENLILSAAER